MRRFTYSAQSVALGAGVSASTSSVLARAYADRSPIYAVEVSPGYRRWQLVAISHEEGLNELRGILSTSLAMRAYRDRKRPFPNGTVLVKEAWNRLALPKPPVADAYVTDAASVVQILVQGSTRYAAPEGGDMAGLSEVSPSTSAMQDMRWRHEAYAAMQDGVLRNTPLETTNTRSLTLIPASVARQSSEHLLRATR
jgi:Cytochrome P460